LTTNLTMTAGTPAARSLHEICELALMCPCGECWQVPGVPCVTDPEGSHLARWLRAERRGLISSADLAAVAATLEVIAPAVIVPEVTL
jgi:hypothetical protein